MIYLNMWKSYQYGLNNNDLPCQHFDVYLQMFWCLSSTCDVYANVSAFDDLYLRGQKVFNLRDQIGQLNTICETKYHDGSEAQSDQDQKMQDAPERMSNVFSVAAKHIDIS